MFKSVKAAYGLVMQRTTYRAEPLNFFVGITFGFICEQTIIGSWKEFVISIRSFMARIQPC